MLSGDTARPYLTEGVGEDFFPGTYDPTMVDRWVRVSDRDAFAMARRITREEGILAGESCGTALVAALDEARRIMRGDAGAAKDAVIVVIFPDGGRNYLSKLYNDEWMRANGLLTHDRRGRPRRRGAAQRPPTARSCPTSSWRGRRIASAPRSTCSSCTASASCRSRSSPTGDAIEGIVGSVSEKGLLDRAYRDPTVVERTVGEVMDQPLPTIDLGARSTTRSRCCPAARRRSSRRRRAGRPASSPSSTCWSTWRTAAHVATEPRRPGLEDPPVETIRTPRLELVSMTIPFMRALQARDLETAGREVGARGAARPGGRPRRLPALPPRAGGRGPVDPAVARAARWSSTDETASARVIGSIGFHGPPDEQGRLEIGYRVEPRYRRRGYAREAVRAMFDWAASTHGIHRFVASVSPTTSPRCS